jgi:hypothetical protein
VMVEQSSRISARRPRKNAPPWGQAGHSCVSSVSSSQQSFMGD